MFVLVGVDVGFLTKGLGGKKISVFGGGSKAVRNSDQLYVTLGDKHELINAR